MDQAEIDAAINGLAGDVSRPVETNVPIDTADVLLGLAEHQDWGPTETRRLAHLSKQINIDGELFVAYGEDGKPLRELGTIDLRLSALAFAVLVKFYATASVNGATPVTMSRLNTALKAADLANGCAAKSVHRLTESLRQSLSTMSARLPSDEPAKDDVSDLEATGPGDQGSVLPITVLFHEGPIARAYLDVLRFMGVRPERVAILTAKRDVTDGKILGRWLPNSLRRNYAASVQRNRIHYWPQRLAGKHPKLVEDVVELLSARFALPANLIIGSGRLDDVGTYTDRVDKLFIDGLSDPTLRDYLSMLPSTTLLYTGGGIVPSSLLDHPEKPMVHIHPGHLPDVRGADGLLWSVLIHGRPSASAFIMSAGIDTGVVLARRWMPTLDFGNIEQPFDIPTLYRTLYSFVDPWLRADMLRRTIRANLGLRNLEGQPQNAEEGATYHFMHDALKSEVLAALGFRIV